MARGLAVLAIFTSAVFWSVPLRADDVTAPSAAGSGLGLGNPIAALSLDQLAATRERPLFSPTRRPPPPPPPPPVASAVDPLPPALNAPPNLALYGIIMDETGARAIVRPKEAGATVGVRVSDEVGGWKVVQIDRRQLTLSLEDRSVTFTLFDRHGSSEHPQVIQHAARVLELNPAGILTARRISKSHP